jgi:hypothetical protein
MPACILALPELSNSFRRLIQPFTIRQQRKQFDGAEKLHRVRVWPAQWPRFPSGKIKGQSFFICKSLLKD